MPADLLRRCGRLLSGQLLQQLLHGGQHLNSQHGLLEGRQIPLKGLDLPRLRAVRALQRVYLEAPSGGSSRTLALAAGRSIRWVADQLGHSNPALTLRVFAHAMPVEEQDLGFADFGSPPERLQTALSGSG